ncbi:murein hydrolase activator EnvC family protein [Actinomycetospora sp. C-140]
MLAAVLLAVPAPASTAPAPPPVVPVGAYGWPLAGVDPAGAPARSGQPGAVTRPFDPPPHFYGRGHRGADLAGRPGLAVVTAGDGVVVFAGALAGRGVVSVEHAGGLRTTYEPLVVGVAPGARVRRGDALGTLASGHRGCPVAACLHWGLRRPATATGAGGLEYLDPLLLLGLGSVRLLPTDP